MPAFGDDPRRELIDFVVRRGLEADVGIVASTSYPGRIVATMSATGIARNHVCTKGW